MPLLLAILLAAVPATHLPPPSAQTFRHQLGIAPHDAVTHLVRSRGWQWVLGRIDQGDAAWIALAPRIARWTDAGDTESLRIALARAIPLAPQAVLRAGLAASRDPATKTIDLDAVCSTPFIEPGAAWLARYRRDATAALARVPSAPARACAAHFAPPMPNTVSGGVLAGSAFQSLASATERQCPGIRVRNLTPAGLLDLEDRFTDRLSPPVRLSLTRDERAQSAHCGDRPGAACPATANLTAIARAGLTPRFSALLCRPAIVR